MRLSILIRRRWFAAALGAVGALGIAALESAHADPLRLPAPTHVAQRQPERELLLAPLPENKLTVEELEELALANNPSLARAAAVAAAARGNWQQAGLPPNPVVGFEAQQIGSDGLAEQDGVLVEQEFVRGGKLRLSRNVAAMEWNRAEQELAAQRQRVLTDVRLAFYQTLVAQQQRKTTAELVSIAERGAQAADALFKAKEVSRADVLQAELEVETAHIFAQNASNRYSAAWRQLAAVVGDLRLPAREVAGELRVERAPVEWEAAVERVLSTSPEIAAAAANIERARWALARACAEPRPNVTVQGLVNWRDNGIGGGSDGGVTVTMPLPAWNKNQGAINAARSEVVVAERALDQLELRLVERLAPVFERYQNARQQVARYEAKILPAAEENLELTRKAYGAQELGYLNLLTAQRTYSQTQLNYLEALRELRTAEAEIDGLLLRDSLEAR